MQACPNCGKPNAETDAYCYSCGHILPSTMRDLIGSTSKLEDAYQKLEPKRRWGTAYFDQQARLVLTFREPEQQLVVEVMRELVLGRSHQEPGVPAPDVDLTPYKAIENGVSRRHVALVRDRETIGVKDLGSVNYTYLNGQRLMAHETRILRDNDELRLGRLVIRVNFVDRPSAAE